jgi:hypothetical protein
MKAYEGQRNEVGCNLDPGIILRPRNEVPWMVRMMTLPLPTVPFPWPYASKLTILVNSRVNRTFKSTGVEYVEVP